MFFIKRKYIEIKGAFQIDSGIHIKAFCKAKSDSATLVLTFDDGPVPETVEILKVLEKFGVTATFFCIGKNIDAYPYVLAEIAQKGHSIGNHTYSHSKWIDFYSASRFFDELKKTDESIFSVLGHNTRLFRPPYGITNPAIRKAVEKRDAMMSSSTLTIGWSIRSLDTQIRDFQKLFRRITRMLHPGGIILFHDPILSPALLEDFLQFVKKSEYQIQPLENLFETSIYETDYIY